MPLLREGQDTLEKPILGRIPHDEFDALECSHLLGGHLSVAAGDGQAQGGVSFAQLANQLARFAGSDVGNGARVDDGPIRLPGILNYPMSLGLDAPGQGFDLGLV